MRVQPAWGRARGRTGVTITAGRGGRVSHRTAAVGRAGAQPRRYRRYIYSGMSGVKMHSRVTMNAPCVVRMIAPATVTVVPAAARMAPPAAAIRTAMTSTAALSRIVGLVEAQTPPLGPPGPRGTYRKRQRKGREEDIPVHLAQ